MSVIWKFWINQRKYSNSVQQSSRWEVLRQWPTFSQFTIWNNTKHTGKLNLSTPKAVTKGEISTRMNILLLSIEKLCYDRQSLMDPYSSWKCFIFSLLSFKRTPKYSKGHHGIFDFLKGHRFWRHSFQSRLKKKIWKIEIFWRKIRQQIKRDFTDGKKMSPVEYCNKQSRGAVQRLIRKPSQYKM